MRVRLCSALDADREIACEIAALLRERARERRTFVLGLAAGKSPRGVYRELIALHRAAPLPIAALRAFSLDEYAGLAPSDPRSFGVQIRAELHEPLGLAREHAAVPRGDLSPELRAAHCIDYGRAIRAAGGIDLQLLGIGRNGHVAFNEPGAARASRMRVVELSDATRADAVAAFGSLDSVPREALTLGIADILEARRVRLLAFGASKCDILAACIERADAPELPASWLASHADCAIYTDCATERIRRALSADAGTR